jgi:ACS family glucarate transporter-like MFS transporter
MVFIVFVVAAVSYLDRNNISIAASAVQKEYGLTTVQLGSVFSAFVLGYAFTQPIAGRIADRFGPYRTIAIGLVWWSVFTALTPMVPPGAGALMMLLAVRFILGVGEAVIFPSSNRLVASWIPSSERGLANGLIFAGVGVGAGLAPPLITFVMLSQDWRAAFWASALIGMVVLVAWLIVARDRPEEHRAIQEAELDYIRSGLPQAQTAVGKPLPWLTILRDRQVAVLTASYFCYGYVAYIFFTWFFKYLSDVRGLNLKASAIYGMLPFIAMAVASPLGGWLGDRLSKTNKRLGRCGVAGFGLCLASVFVAAATQVADARLASLVLAGGAGALYLSQSAFWAMSADIGRRSAGSVSGVMNMGNQIGGVLTASLTAYLATQFGWTFSFLVAAAVCLVGGLAWFFVDPHHSLETES